MQVKINTSHLELEKNPITVFVDKLVKKAGIVLPEEELFFYKKRLSEQLQRRLGLISLDNLDKKGMADYVKMVEKKPTEKQMENFFVKHIPNYREIITKALDEFAEDFLKAVK
ncbi:hypothetical protein J7J81_01395 [bacterium]|nr:hypothetical protein [bacterium]